MQGAWIDMRMIGVLASVTFSSLLTLGVGAPQAHPKLDGYVSCAQTIALPSNDQSYFETFGVKNTCSIAMVGVVCVSDGYGKKSRWSTPVNLPPGHTHYYSNYAHDKGIRAVDSFTCIPSATCFAGPEAHDPHCH